MLLPHPFAVHVVSLGYTNSQVTEGNQFLLRVDADKRSEMAQKEFIDFSKYS